MSALISECQFRVIDFATTEQNVQSFGGNVKYCLNCPINPTLTLYRQKRYNRTMEIKKTNSDTHSELYHWFRSSVLRCGLPTRIAFVWGGIYVLAATISPGTGGVVGGYGMLAFLFYVVLNFFFNVDYWLFKKELEYDHPEHYGPGGKLKKL